MTFRYSFSQKVKYALSLLSILFLAIAFGFLLGKFTSPQIRNYPSETSSHAVPEQLLKLSVTPSPQPATQIIQADNLKENFEYDIRYINITDVTIELNSTIQSLEEAFQNGITSEEEILFFARADARNGFCVQESESKHGLTHFTFIYPDYNLRIVHDILEAPDGKQHLISDLCIYLREYNHTEYNLGPYTDFTNPKTGVRLDLEDWGLNLEVLDITFSGLKLNCTQSEGQQIGSLVLTGMALMQNNKYVTRLDSSPEMTNLDVTLLSNNCTEITIDWTQDYGELPAGEYQLILDIYDIFEESQVHPLMEDFHDRQVYTHSFTIP